MTDTPTPTPTGQAPPWLLQLQQRLVEADKVGGEAAITDVAAKWMGLPGVGDCPTPGQARNWSKEQWEEWAKTFGYVFQGRTTHSYLFQHGLVPHLNFGIATTPGDFRTPMAMAREVRCGIRDAVARLRPTVVAVACIGINPKHDADEAVVKAAIGKLAAAAKTRAADADAAFRALLPDGVYDSDDKLVALNAAADELLRRYMARKDADKHEVDFSLINSRFRVLKNEFDVGPKQAMKMAMGADYDGQEAEVAKLLEVLKLCRAGDTIPFPDGIVDNLSDAIEFLREAEKADKEYKRAEREREREEREVKARPKTLRELTQEGIDGRRQLVIDQLRSYEKLAQSLVDRMRLAQTQVPVFPLPEFADPAELKAARDEIVYLRESGEAGHAQVEHLKKQLAETGDAKVLAEQIETARAFAAVAADTLKGVVQMNPFQMVSALQALQQQAEEVMGKLAPTKETAA